jgi:putative component of membrane protein insertase Oxa1/YidC/SpoIIIJ protein YidD
VRRFWILLIHIYQRFISPYKGFRCAHAVYHSGPSCSSAVKTIIFENGLVKGLPAIKKRFAECNQAYLLILAEKQQDDNKKDKQKPSRCKQEKDQCGGNCITSPCDVLSCCQPGKGVGKNCDFDPCDGGSCDVGPCDCSP